MAQPCAQGAALNRALGRCGEEPPPATGRAGVCNDNAPQPDGNQTAEGRSQLFRRDELEMSSLNLV